MAGLWRTVALVVVAGLLACTREPGVVRSAGSQDNYAASRATNSTVAEGPLPAGADPQDETDKAELTGNAADEAKDQTAETAEFEDAEGEAILRNMAEFYQQARSLTVEGEHVMTVRIQGNEHSVTSNCEIAAERPNRLMMRSTGETVTPDVYQNGDSLVLHVGAVNRYAEEEAFESFSDLLGSSMVYSAGGTAPMVLHLLSDDPAESLMEGVEKRLYVGREEIGGESVHHLRFLQDQYDRDAWIRAEGDPLLMQVATDMSKSLGAFAPGDQTTPKMTLTETYRNWSINQPIEDGRFVFTPPEGAEQVDNLFEGLFGEEEPSPLLSLADPPAGLELLEIPAGPEVQTREGYAEKERQLLTRTILEAYQAQRAEQDADDPKAEQLERFFQSYIDLSVSGRGSSVAGETLEQGKELADGGCKDPMFAYCLGIFLQNQSRLEEAALHLRFAYENFPDTAYDVSYRCWTANHLSIVLDALNRHTEAADLIPEPIALLSAAVSEGNYLPDEQRVLFGHIEWFLSNSPLPKLQPIIAKLSNRDDVDPWLKHMMSAYVDVRLAWQARGGGWASSVTDEGWEGFARHQKRAYEHLSQAWQLNPEAPESAAKMIELAMSGHTPRNETPQFWFNRAVTAQIDYIPAYHNLRWALTPRWGGSHRAMYDLGRKALHTGRFDTWVPFELFKTVKAIVDDIGTNESVYQSPGVYEDMLQMCDGYADQEGPSWNPNWFRTMKIALAVKCEKWPDAGEFLGALSEDTIEAQPFVELGLRRDESLGEIHARTGDLAEKYAQAEKLIAEANFDDAVAQYKLLIDQAAGQQHVTTYFRGRLSSLERDRQFHVGEWTSILPNERLDGWVVKSGNWSVDEQGRLTGESATEGLELDCRQSFGTRFELRGEAEFLTSPFSKFNIGVSFGQQTDALRSSIRFYRYEGYLGLFEVSSEEPLEQQEADVNDVNRFHIQRWDNTLSVALNDEPALTNLVIDSYGPSSSEIFGLGGRYWYNGAKIRFKQLEIRQLAAPPEDPDEAK